MSEQIIQKVRDLFLFPPILTSARVLSAHTNTPGVFFVILKLALFLIADFLCHESAELSMTQHLWQCPLCHNTFRGVSKSRHQRNLYLKADDINRCDNKNKKLSSADKNCSEVGVDLQSGNEEQEVVGAEDVGAEDVGGGVDDVVRTPLTPLHELARRSPVNMGSRID